MAWPYSQSSCWRSFSACSGCGRFNAWAGNRDERGGRADWREDIDLQTHRYMLEDIACGLAFLVSCGDYAGAEVPVARDRRDDLYGGWG